MSSGNELISSPPKSQRRYATRGSGVSPKIEGLDIQPWEFNFTFNQRKKSQKKPRTPAPSKNDTDKKPDVNSSIKDTSSRKLSPNRREPNKLKSTVSNPKSPKRKLDFSSAEVKTKRLLGCKHTPPCNYYYDDKLRYEQLLKQFGMERLFKK